MKPTPEQSISLYQVCNWITERLQEPITIVRLDERRQNIYIQYGPEDLRFFLVTPTGEVKQDEY